VVSSGLTHVLARGANAAVVSERPRQDRSLTPGAIVADCPALADRLDLGAGTAELSHART
jgi:hypothetical protein